MSTLTPWAQGPFDLIIHAEMHYKNGEDFDRRIALIGFDNAVEVAITTYLSLNPIQRGNRQYRREQIETWLNNYHTKIDFFMAEIAIRGVDCMCGKETIVWYHDVRGDQYHGGGATIPQSRELEGIRKVAFWVFGILFDVDDVEKLMDEHLNRHTGNDLPKRNGEHDRLIDGEYGMVGVAGRLYYTSETLYALDAVLYSEVAADITRRDATNNEMEQGNNE